MSCCREVVVGESRTSFRGRAVGLCGAVAVVLCGAVACGPEERSAAGAGSSARQTVASAPEFSPAPGTTGSGAPSSKSDVTAAPTAGSVDPAVRDFADVLTTALRVMPGGDHVRVVEVSAEGDTAYTVDVRTDYQGLVTGASAAELDDIEAMQVLLRRVREWLSAHPPAFRVVSVLVSGPPGASGSFTAPGPELGPVRDRAERLGAELLAYLKRTSEGRHIIGVGVDPGYEVTLRTDLDAGSFTNAEKLKVDAVQWLGEQKELPVGPRLTVLNRDYGELTFADLPL